MGDGFVQRTLSAANGESGDVDPATRQGGHRRAIAHLAVAANQGEAQLAA